jgi:hypothetical protein
MLLFRGRAAKHRDDVVDKVQLVEAVHVRRGALVRALLGPRHPGFPSPMQAQASQNAAVQRLRELPRYRRRRGRSGWMAVVAVHCIA